MELEKMVQQLLDRALIIQAVNSYGIGVDTRNFALFRSILAEEVTVDYTSMFGGEPYRIAADVLVENWRGLLTQFESTQHIISNHVIDLAGDAATCTSHFQAHHILLNRRGGCSWTVAGFYVHRLARTAAGWKIGFTQLNNLWGEGNFDLVMMAQQLSTKKR